MRIGPIELQTQTNMPGCPMRHTKKLPQITLSFHFVYMNIEYSHNHTHQIYSAYYIITGLQYTSGSISSPTELSPLLGGLGKLGFMNADFPLNSLLNKLKLRTSPSLR